MYRNSLRLLGYLVVSYLLTACQAKQYGFFQASNSVYNQSDQGESGSLTTPETAEQYLVIPADTTALVAEPLTKLTRSVGSTATKVRPVSLADRSIRKTDKKVYRKAVRAELRKAVKLARLQPVQGETNGLAKAAFILGLATLILLFIPAIGGLTLVTGPLALIFGIISLGQIRRNDQKGVGLGIAGIALGAIYTLLLLIAVAAISSLRR